MLRDFIISCYHPIMLSSYYGISIWIYKSLKHRLWKRPPERAQRASLTSSVYSYLRSILTATSPTIFSSFYFTCSRDFIIGIMVLWYYGLVFEYINLSDIDCATYHSFIFRLFLLFALSLRSFACFAGPFLRRLCFTYVSSFFISGHYLPYHLSCAFSIGDRKWPI